MGVSRFVFCSDTAVRISSKAYYGTKEPDAFQNAKHEPITVYFGLITVQNVVSQRNCTVIR